MSNRGIFFILGAGASVDSGLKTYRGENGVYNNSPVNPAEILSPSTLHKDPQIIWDFLKPLYQSIDKATLGKTYKKITELITHFPRSFVMTQNIDMLAQVLPVPIVEMHGTVANMSCIKCKIVKRVNFDNLTCSCGSYFRPSIVLYEESIPRENFTQLANLSSPRPDYVVVIGTTAQFPYIQMLIDNVKGRGSKVIHINPDKNYKVQSNERFINKTAVEGIQDILNEINSGEF
jgi:NAD-dependent deacetylase